MKSDVIKYEKILNESEKIYSELQILLEKLMNNMDDFESLKKYYGSEEFRKDVLKSNETDEYADIACGVLSEDAPYNLIGTSYTTSIEMLEIATKILKNY